jgi:hypothetical protein
VRLILDEKHLLNRALNEGFVYKKPSVTIRILAKHYLSKGMNNEQVYDIISSFLSKNYADYIPMNWHTSIKGIINKLIKSKDYSLVYIENVKITKNEISKIKLINDIELERLAFTLLVYAKIYNQINDNSSNWVNERHGHIFKDAKISAEDIKQGKMIYELNKAGLIFIPLKNESINIKVEFVDNSFDESDVAITINNFENFVYEYYKYFDPSKFIYCSECGKLIKPTNNKNKYCDYCAREIKLHQNKLWKREYDKSRKIENLP